MRSRQNKLAGVAKMGVLVLVLSAAAFLQSGCAYNFWAAWQNMTGNPIPPSFIPATGSTEETDPTEPGPTSSATVLATVGVAQKMVLLDGKPAWKPIEAGDQLDELSVVRTGLNSRLAMGLPDGSRVALGSATKMGIASLGGDGEASRVTLKYGSLALTRPANASVQVETPRGAVNLVGGRGGVSCGGLAGLNLTGDRAWQAVGGGGAPRNPAGAQLATAGGATDTRMIASTASAARDRSMAAAVTRTHQPTAMPTPAWTPTYRPRGNPATITTRRITTRRVTPVTAAPDIPAAYRVPDRGPS